MYRGFQLALDPTQFAAYQAAGNKLYVELGSAVKKILQQYAVSGTVLDGSKMQADWFPQVEADVFISHAHADQELAIALGGWLNHKFGIRTFIDSCIWGHADILLRKIDMEHCWKSVTNNFDYTRRNRSTAHVHMMLNNALSKMIDHSECLFFLDTPRSTVEDIVKTKTESPWIYSEISQSQLIRKKIPTRSTTTELIKSFSGGRSLNESQREEARIQYMLELDHLEKLNTTELLFWSNTFQAKKSLLHIKEGHPLDTLYNMKPLKKN
jgi:hypothetical protein